MRNNYKPSYKSSLTLTRVILSITLAALLTFSCGGSGSADKVGFGIPSEMAETTNPTVLSKTPAADSTGIAVDTSIIITFSEAMDSSTINTSTFILAAGSEQVAGSVSYAGETNTATFTPSINLANGTLYTATLKTDILDTYGNSLDETTWSFTTLYLFTTQHKKLVAADAEAGDKFGTSVAISGNYLIVGAPEEDAGGSAAGAAYIFYYDSGTGQWDGGAKIVAPDAALGNYFGVSVSISGDYAVVGTKAESAYIFHRTDTNSWDSGTKIVASDGSTYFGYPVSISGDYAIVGSCCYSYIDKAYIFHRTGTNTWDTGTIIVNPDTDLLDRFGDSVSISGDYAIVGNPWDDALGFGAGAAYIFYRDADTGWDAGTKIGATDASSDANFGSAVSISDQYAVVTSNSGLYIFNRTDTNSWDSGTKVFTPEPETTFGDSVAVDGDNVIANKYIFRRNSSGWNSGTTIIASGVTDDDNFGGSVGIDGDYAVIGASSQDSGSVDSGAAYIFK